MRRRKKRRWKGHHPKSASQRSHAKRRALYRLGVRLHDDLRRRIIRAIQDGRAKFIERQSNRITVHQLEIEGEPANVVYDSQTEEIVTFLFPGDEQ